MSDKLENPYVHPTEYEAADVYGDRCTNIEPGITLRDYFAAHALMRSGAIAGAHNLPKHAAREAYMYADEMLKARQVKPEGE